MIMETCSLPRPILPLNPSIPPKHFISQFPKLHKTKSSHVIPPKATLKSRKGFNSSSKKTKKKTKQTYNDSDDDDEDEEDDDDDGGVIPEIVTNRMIGRIGLSVGIPMFTGLLFFPFFWYLKVGFKLDIPTWIPYIVSFIFFGTALLGVTYGIVSTSWDPMREGSFLGWNEAKKNWPVFWQSIKGRTENK